MATRIPAPPPDLARLQPFLGSWIGEETLPAGAPLAPDVQAIGKIVVREDLGGHVFLIDNAQEIQGQIVYRAHGVFAFDGRSRKFVLHWFDTTETLPTAPWIGDFDGRSLILEVRTATGFSRATYGFPHPDRMDLRVETSPDRGHWTPYLLGRYVRR